jgi:uncharacterized protein (DUF488 family)
VGIILDLQSFLEDQYLYFRLRKISMYTIGHSTRPQDEFIHILKHYGIEELVDIRKIPRSGYNPQYNMESLSAALEGAGIRYRHYPELGGLRKARANSINTGWRSAGFRGFADYMLTPEFERAVSHLIQWGEDHVVAVMCAEAVPWRCHRMLLSDGLLVHGVKVDHIHSLKKAEPHRLTAFAKVDGTQLTYPSADPKQPALPL